MKDFFKNVSVESEDIGSEPVIAPAPLADNSAVATGLVEQERIERVANDEAASAITDDHDLLSEVAARVDEIQESQGGLSVESLLFASIATDHALRRLGLPEGQLQYPSLESVKLDDRIQVSTEQLNVSNEALLDTIKSVMKHQVSAAVRAWSFTGTRIRKRIKQMEKIQQLAERTDGDQKSGDITIDISKLHREGSTPTDLPAFVNEFYVVAEKLVKDFTPKAIANFGEFTRVSKAVPLKKAEDFEPGFKKLADSLKDARDMFSEAQLKAVYPGGLRLFEDKKSKYKGDNPSAQRLDAFATKNVPVRAGFRSPGGTGVVGNAHIKPLTKEQVAESAKQALRALHSVQKFATGAANMVGGLTTVIPNPGWIMGGTTPFGIGATVGANVSTALNATAGPKKATKTRMRQRWGHRKELRALNDAYRTARNMCLFVGQDAAGSLATVTGAMVPVLKASLRTYR